MRYWLFSALWLLSGCASAPKTFQPMDTCSTTGGKISCVDTGGKFYTPDLTQGGGYLCFKRDQFKAFDEICHEK